MQLSTGNVLQIEHTSVIGDREFSGAEVLHVGDEHSGVEMGAMGQATGGLYVNMVPRVYVQYHVLDGANV